MAAVESFKGKTVETVKLRYSPSYPGAVSWSSDGRISVITDQCVYVLTPIPWPVYSGLYMEKTSIPNPKIKPSVVDVGIDRLQITGESSEWTLNPDVNSALGTSTGFQKIAWSPQNCDENGRCVLATLFSDYHLCVYLSPTLGNKWREVFDLSNVLCSYLRKNSFKIDEDVLQASAQEVTQLSHAKRDNSKYFQFVQRTQMLAFTSLHWFSEIYHTRRDMSVTDLDTKGKDSQFAVLATGNQSGHVIFWNVTVPVRIGNSEGVQLGGFLNTQQTWPCSLSWQRITNNQGLLAVGSTDGLVKVFSINVLPAVTGVAQYVLWGDRDELQVQWLEWLPSSQVINSGYQLVACKGSSVIIFAMSVKNGILLQKPTHRIITEIHRIPITGLDCALNGTIFTCSLDGSVQMSTADGTPTRSVDYDAKRGFLCNGIGVSANAAFIVLFLSPANYTRQSVEAHQTHIVFVNTACGASSITRLLNDKDVHMDKKWDACKALQHFTDHGRNMTEEIHQLISSEDMETFSHVQLILRQHMLSLMVSASQNEQDANQTQPTHWSSQLECTINYMYQRLATATLRSWVEGKESGTVNDSDNVSVLLICDWLVMTSSDSAMVDLVTKVYQACSDTKGLNTVATLQHQIQESFENASSSKSASVWPQMRTTTQGENSEVAAEGSEEIVSELMDTNQNPAQVSMVFCPESSLKGSQIQTIAQGDNSDALTESGEEMTSELMDTNASQADVALLEGGCKNMTSLPAREKCPICQSDIPMESLSYGTCFNGHKWQRCCVSFTVCADVAHKCCQDCNRCVSVPHIGLSAWMNSLLQSASKCPFCLGFFCLSC